jgi:hypothetical protein
MGKRKKGVEFSSRAAKNLVVSSWNYSDADSCCVRGHTTQAISPEETGERWLL